MKAFILSLALGAFSQNVLAAQPVASVQSCDGLDSIARLHYGGVLRVGQYELAVVDSGKDSGSSDFLLVFGFGDDGYYSCKAIGSSAKGNGFCKIDLRNAQSSGDQNVDLRIPVTLTYNESTGKCENSSSVGVSIRSHYPDTIVKLSK